MNKGDLAIEYGDMEQALVHAVSQDNATRRGT